MTMPQKDDKRIPETMAEAETVGRRRRREKRARTKSVNSDLGLTRFDCATLWPPVLNSHQSPANLENRATAVMIYGNT